MNRRLLFPVLLGFSIAAHAASIGIETYSAGLSGFGPNTTSSTVVAIPAGGNPDGFIETRKSLTPPVFDIGALTSEPSFTGDYAAGGIGGVGVDLNYSIGTFTGAWIRFRPDIVNNGWRHAVDHTLPLNAWNTFTVFFDPTWSDATAQANGWVTDRDIDPAAIASPSFASVMTSVDFAEVRIGSSGSTLVGIDNFRLLGVQPVPDSAGWAVELAALVGLWGAGRRWLR